MQHRITTPLLRVTREQLRVGDTCLLNGEIYTARDAAHARLVAALKDPGLAPLDLQDALIYYVGPCRPQPGSIIGAAGPTTSGRMDTFTPMLLEQGLAGTIGKGKRSPEVKSAMLQQGAVYFAATGGAGALLAQSIVACELLLYPELGAEAVYRLQVKDFPLLVAFDCQGNDIYELGPKRFKTDQKN